jgi:Domain of unknown function (DUF4440)
VADKSLTELIRIYFKAYEAKDRSALESTLSDDFTFTSPHDDHIDRATYLERCWPNSKHTWAIHFANFSIAATKPLSSTIWNRTTDNHFATRNSSLEAAARSKRSKCISVRKSAELRTSSNSVLSTQDKSLESRSACSTVRLASVSIGCQ